MTARVPVYDTGMLIALANRKAKAVHLHAGIKATPHRAIVPGPVFGQVWRPRPATLHALSTTLNDCTIPQARSSLPALRPTKAGQPSCLTCATPPDLAHWKRIGTALGEALLPPKKRPDVVDAFVALTALQHGSAVVFTSDKDDIRAYLNALGTNDVHVVAV